MTSATALPASAVGELCAQITGWELPDTEVEAADLVTRLEALKSACAAAQARVTMRWDQLRTDTEAHAGVPASRRGRGLAAEVALARRVSAGQGARHLGFARALTSEMPFTLAALTSGVLSEWRATILVRETGYLTKADRIEIDRRVCGDADSLDGVGDAELDAWVKRLAYELDPHAVVARNASAPKDRYVSTRPAPDAMVRLSALLPLAQGISVFAALKAHADATVGADERTRAQIMADTLVQRCTGQQTATATPIAVNVTVPAAVLARDSDAAAQVDGYGPIPADTARSLMASALDAHARVEMRRVFASPAGAVVAMESRARLFPSGLQRVLDARDQGLCRLPYCDAPIVEYDHAQPHSRGGPTSAHNGLGMCATHNRAKQNPGWNVTTHDPPGGRHTAVVSTPTGATHMSTAPPLPGFEDHKTSRVELRLMELLAA
ncbi:DUF222 domain-containing protein [Williamsia sp. CHRR-6]|uniref:HNH endonuclease n=1 Tax=Williamsia sp. CHRR-6 TaxID=2835871 RepID=UPI001BD99AEF|nr:DUF222 domain-containing protein [Williamsia sp. CHRR-6]MBT0567506.1 DUF222 domain-containing protein [Williamsia sp. CHRR-6]